MNEIFGHILVIAIAFLFVLCGNTLSEIAYKKRSIGEVKKDFPKIFKNSLIVVGVLIFFTYLYALLGIEFSE